MEDFGVLWYFKLIDRLIIIGLTFLSLDLRYFSRPTSLYVHIVHAIKLLVSSVIYRPKLTSLQYVTVWSFCF